LLGEMNYTTQTATTFRGQSTVIFGVNAGYAVGDLDLEAFRYNGAASSGNLSVTGTYFATRAGTTAYTWDTRGRLTGATTIDTSSRIIAQTAYQYDVQDRRIGRTENSEGVIVDRDRYLYQGEHVAAVASDSDGDGNYRITDRYLHSMATDAVLSMVSSVEATGASVNAPTTASLASAELLWTLTDHLGSVRDVVSAGGSIVRQHINYDAFGNRVGEVHRSSTGALINSDSAAAVDALFGYAGREWDDSIDLQYNRARWYDPATGRFISQDPIGFEAGDANLYRYVGNGPTNFVDPSGLHKGHHIVVVQVRRLVPQAAFDVFDSLDARITNDAYRSHNYGKFNGIKHCDYNTAVIKEFEEFVSKNKINPKKMTADQARDFVNHLKNLPASSLIKKFNKGVQAAADAAKLAAKAAAKSGKLVKAAKGGGKLAKAIPGVGFFFAVAGWGVDGYCKGPVNGTINSGIDAIPFVGGGKILIELTITGDWIPDTEAVEEVEMEEPTYPEHEQWLNDFGGQFPDE
jgi:RHS repeat-associated protein